jgi:thiol-disulfide isomerase/thioredoxin
MTSMLAATVGTHPHFLTAAPPVNDDTFEELVLKSNVPVLIDFWAPWCGPCRMIAPLIDELATEYNGKLKCVSTPFRWRLWRL